MKKFDVVFMKKTDVVFMKHRERSTLFIIGILWTYLIFLWVHT